MTQTVSWETAIAGLRRFIAAPTDYSSPDRLSAAADGIAGPAVWLPIPGWEDLPDLDILDRMFADQSPLVGSVIVVTDSMFTSGNPPAWVPTERLREFVAGHVASTGECFFNGDVVILAPDSEMLSIFHHEGMFAHWHLGRGSGDA